MYIRYNATTVLPKRFTKRARQLDQAARELPAQAAKRIIPAVFSPLPYVMPSSSTPDFSENSDSSEDPTYLAVEKTLPVKCSLHAVSNQLPETEPASIAERILSSEGRMSSAQQACIASAVRLARMMSPDQLSARSGLGGWVERLR